VQVLDDMGVAAHETVMFEDSLKNVRACRQLGMGTVFVTGNDPEQGLGELGAQEGGDATAQLAALADAVVSKCSLAQLRPALPSLWE
jgi:FMN phosphatase YigB (HAD superfamily)